MSYIPPNNMNVNLYQVNPDTKFFDKAVLSQETVEVCEGITEIYNPAGSYAPPAGKLAGKVAIKVVGKTACKLAMKALGPVGWALEAAELGYDIYKAGNVSDGVKDYLHGWGF